MCSSTCFPLECVDGTKCPVYLICESARRVRWQFSSLIVSQLAFGIHDRGVSGSTFHPVPTPLPASGPTTLTDARGRASHRAQGRGAAALRRGRGLRGSPASGRGGAGARALCRAASGGPVGGAAALGHQPPAGGCALDRCKQLKSPFGLYGLDVARRASNFDTDCETMSLIGFY